jgi:hypothetical protein
MPVPSHTNQITLNQINRYCGKEYENSVILNRKPHLKSNKNIAVQLFEFYFIEEIEVITLLTTGNANYSEPPIKKCGTCHNIVLVYVFHSYIIH